MSDASISFDHIHLISEDPRAAAQWYRDMLGATIGREFELRKAPQISVGLGGMTLLIRGRRPGEAPAKPRGMRHFDDYSSHDEWGTDHFGYRYHGDLTAFCEELRSRGAAFAVEPWEFMPGSLICYLAAPDGVSIEIVEAKPAS